MAKYFRVELSLMDHSQYSFDFVDEKRVRALKQWARGFDDDVMEFDYRGKTYWFHRRALMVLSVEPEWVLFEWLDRMFEHTIDPLRDKMRRWVLEKMGGLK